MKIKDVLEERSTGVSFEFFPPKSDEARGSFVKVVEELGAYDPLYVSVTYGAGGTTQSRTVDTLGWIREATDLTVMSHLTCIGATRETLDDLLRGYLADGIDNVLALRGDPPVGVSDFDPTKGEFAYAKDLVGFVRGFDGFSIGVAVFPEGHGQAPSLEKDTEYMKMKVDAGAEFAISQMFFDNRYFFELMERAGGAGIDIPILPGIMPITDLKKIMGFAEFCDATIPPEIVERMRPFTDLPEDMRKVGIEIAIEQCDELIRAGVPFFHFYALNRSEAVSQIIDALGMASRRSG
jgi:methylenetetrahydrofolate reductase (NADH)